MTNVFRASRFTRGNFLFPTVLEVTDQTLVRRKRSWFHVSETTMHLSRVASVTIDTGLLFADLRVESSGGGEDIVSHGHTKGDAKRVKALVEDWQAGQLGREAQPAASS
jgi:hypothetical protein